MRALADDRGASPVEFVLVGALLTFLTLGVLQLGFSVYIRNVVQDAAVSGAFHAALADTSLAEGAARTRSIVDGAVGGAIIDDVAVREVSTYGYPAVEVHVTATLPLIGLLGVPRGMEVSAHAPLELLD